MVGEMQFKHKGHKGNEGKMIEERRKRGEWIMVNGGWLMVNG